MPAIFVDTIGDTLSLWIFYTLSQKYLQRSLNTGRNVPDERTTTDACCARFPYVLQHECLCEPISNNVVQNDQALILLIAYMTFISIHRLTSLGRRAASGKSNSTLLSGVFLFLAPAGATLGLPQYFVSWINWIICHITAIWCGHSLLVRIHESLKLLFRHYEQVKDDLQQQGITLKDALWNFLRCSIGISWLFVGFVSMLNYLFSSRNATDVFLSSSYIANLLSMTSSPFAFIGMCVFCGQLYFFTLQVVACFVSMTIDTSGTFNRDTHASIFWLVFQEGIFYYLFGQPVHLSFFQIYFGLMLPSVFVLTQTLVRLTDLPTRWLHVRAFLVYLVLPVISLSATYACTKIYGLFGSPVICMLTTTTFCIDIMSSAINSVMYVVDEMSPIRPWDTIMDASRFIQVRLFIH